MNSISFHSGECEKLFGTQIPSGTATYSRSPRSTVPSTSNSMICTRSGMHFAGTGPEYHFSFSSRHCQCTVIISLPPPPSCPTIYRSNYQTPGFCVGIDVSGERRQSHGMAPLPLPLWVPRQPWTRAAAHRLRTKGNCRGEVLCFNIGLWDICGTSIKPQLFEPIVYMWVSIFAMTQVKTKESSLKIHISHS